ncbi:putative regulator of g protein signaling superfamily protein [Eutypa lata UCREL1]|uniref:Putative regulator of g protein signaling superfamily protein n=1 Tax=Eutypa lata (strain UCR-EL1) TaxID=1287681 RepID=M7TBB0_EUTLA|nr:putative regulator of g protein signaling superfamily protein [Eutypa lata UCREL1]
MVLSLTYRRPAYVEKDKPSRKDSSSSYGEKTDTSLRSGRSGAPAGVPDALSFDKITNGGTCPPCTIRDFMNYLIYIEHSAENLQFFLWYRDYVKRFHAASTLDTALAPEWTQQMEDETVARFQKDAANRRKREHPVARTIFKGSDFEENNAAAAAAAVEATVLVESKDLFATPPSTPGDGDDPSFFSGSQATTAMTTYRTQAHDVFNAAGFKQPFTIQPFRAELARILTTYLAHDAPRQLNLSDRERRTTMAALARTTHPSALRGAARAAEDALRRQAHPNFVRWSICNANPARVSGGVKRGYRATPAVGWVLGIATLVAASKGMCVVLHGMHYRHVRPWELFRDTAAGGEDGGGEDDFSESSSTFFDSFGSVNSYEDEPWVVRYEKRNAVRKIFDRQVWIQEPALRQIQDTIFVQALLAALLVSGVLAAVFVCLPGGNFF